MSNHRKHTETVSVALLAKWIVAAAFLVIAGLCYVYFKNQQHLTGRTINALETELKQLEAANRDLRARASILSSHAVLESHRQSGFIQMIDIADDRIVRVSAPARDELRPVSNSSFDR